MHIAFRVDASLQMGSGHVMRCLTLANVMKTRGAECVFVSRLHLGHMNQTIRERGFEVIELPAEEESIILVAQHDDMPLPAHSDWLGGAWEADARQTLQALSPRVYDWLIVDHYALDFRWESLLATGAERIMVIDDLADRGHDCALLLDQNLGRTSQHYISLVPQHCTVLTGPTFALLRPEFASFRAYSLAHRAHGELRTLLISMGGVDHPNVTCKVLCALKNSPLSNNSQITVVMGAQAPWLQEVHSLAAQMPWPTSVAVNVTDMAKRMAETDVVIGAAGSTSWERCCLGVPSFMFVLAQNQQFIAQALQKAGAAILFKHDSEAVLAQDLDAAMAQLNENPHQLIQMTKAAAAITHGRGAELVADRLLDTVFS